MHDLLTKSRIETGKNIGQKWLPGTSDGSSGGGSGSLRSWMPSNGSRYIPGAVGAAFDTIMIWPSTMRASPSWSHSLPQHSIFSSTHNVTVQPVIRKKTQNNSPAVARVSRPYSWCTLATCVHNCPSMMFRTCCCLRPKCKRSYLLIYITSDTM